MTDASPAGWDPAPPSRPPLASFGQRLGAAVLDGGGDGVSGGLIVGGSAVVAVVLVAAITAPLLYGIGFEGSPRGQTIGTWALGIRVVVVDGPRPPLHQLLRTWTLRR